MAGYALRRGGPPHPWLVVIAFVLYGLLTGSCIAAATFRACCSPCP